MASRADRMSTKEDTRNATKRVLSLRAFAPLMGSAAVAVLIVVACSPDNPGPTGVDPSDTSSIVSEPVVPLSSAASGPGTAALQQGALVYVSMPAGTIPTGALVNITRARGFQLTRPMIEGGLDPVAIPAVIGDRVMLSVHKEGGIVETLITSVPAVRRPRVIRTIPPRGKRDVPLNARLVIVFSEPMRANSLAGIELLRNGTPVGGSVVLSDDAVRAEFQPNASLQPNQQYLLRIPNSVSDLDGNTLEEAVVAEFETSSDVVVASVVTKEAALFRNPFNGKLRTFEMHGVLYGDSRFSGTFSIYYQETGTRRTGEITCFAIRNGRTAWIAGNVTEFLDSDYVGGWGWLAVDNGFTEGGVKDRLTLAHPIEQNGMGTEEDFCAATPSVDPVEGPFTPYELISGDIVFEGQTPPPSTGSIRLVTQTVGVDAPVEGYVFNVGSVTQPIGASDSLSLRNLAPGDYAVSLQGVASICTVVNPLESVSIQAGTLTRVVFTVSCTSPLSGRIALSLGSCAEDDDTLCNEDVFVINADGSGLTRLTSDADFEISPTWSPDGKKLAFAKAEKDGYGYCCAKSAIYVMNDDGSGVTRLTSHESNDANPVWSPDGNKIAFERDGEIHVMNADGSGVTMLTNNPLGWDNHASWSPDSRKIAFASQRSGSGRACNFGDCLDYQIYVMNADGSSVTRVSNTSGQAVSPKWSPDGSKIAFGIPHDPRQIHIIRADGSGTSAVATTHVQSLAIAWSPDATRLLVGRVLEGNVTMTLEWMYTDGSGSTAVVSKTWPEYVGNSGHAWTAVGRQP